MKLFAASLAATALFAGAASAQEYRLPYGDLTLSNPVDARTLDTRIQRKAREACRSFSGLDFMDCQRRFRAAALLELPTSQREDYARASREGRISARVAGEQG